MPGAFRRPTSVALLALVGIASVSAGCASASRAGQDGLVITTLPVHMLSTPIGLTGASVEAGTSPWAAPFVFSAGVLRDGLLTCISAGDLAATPFLGILEAASGPHETYDPLDISAFDTFPPSFDPRRAASVESDAGIGVVSVLLGIPIAGGSGEASEHGTR